MVEAGSGSVLNDYVAGAIGGATGLVFGHPFDTTKVQLQTQQTRSMYHGTFDAIKHIHRQGWVNGFFRGLGFPLFSYGVVNGVFFGVYGHTLSYIKGDKPGPATMMDTFVAGCAGGTLQLVVGNPVEVVKVVLQSQIPHGQAGGGTYFRGPRECISWILSTRGISGLYRGVGAMAYRDIPTYGLYIMVYESLFKYIKASRYSDSQGSIAALSAGGCAGVLAWGSCIPFDCIKSRLQADQKNQYQGIMDCARQMYKQRGYRAFFDGLLVNSVRAFLVNSITFFVYSHLLKVMNNHSRRVQANNL